MEGALIRGVVVARVVGVLHNNMKKWLILLVGSILIVQGCVPGGKSMPTEQKKEENTLNQELLNAVELEETEYRK